MHSCQLYFRGQRSEMALCYIQNAHPINVFPACLRKSCGHQNICILHMSRHSAENALMRRPLYILRHYNIGTLDSMARRPKTSIQARLKNISCQIGVKWQCIITNSLMGDTRSQVTSKITTQMFGRQGFVPIHAWIHVLTVLHVQSTFSHVISTQQILLQYYLLKYFLGKSKNRKYKIFAQKASVENIIKFLKPQENVSNISKSQIPLQILNFNLVFGLINCTVTVLSSSSLQIE